MDDDYRENFYKESLKIEEAVNRTSDKDLSVNVPDRPEIETGTYNGFDAVDQILMGLWLSGTSQSIMSFKQAEKFLKLIVKKNQL